MLGSSPLQRTRLNSPGAQPGPSIGSPLSWATLFDQLSDRLQATLSDVRSRGKLSESDVDAAMREIRLALLEADVNFKVVKTFTKTVKERCLGDEVLKSLDPGQHVVKIVNEELATLMGGTGRELAMANSGPTVILMAGLQGSGKTTACAKLAMHLRKERQGRRPRRLRRLPARRRRAAGHGRQARRRPRLPAGHRPRPGRDRRVGAAAGAHRAPRRADRRHRRPPPHRPGPDGRAGEDPQEDASRTTSCWSSTR